MGRRQLNLFDNDGPHRARRLQRRRDLESWWHDQRRLGDDNTELG